MKNKLAVLAALAALGVLISASAQVIEGARFALRLCAELIVPSLFPFFVLSSLLSRLGFASLLSRYLSGGAARLFGVSGAGATALFVGLTGGYPLGAVYIAQLAESGAIDEREGERLLAFCNNSGPAFIVGAVGVGVFHSPAAGLGLYLCHIAAAVLTGLILRGDGGVQCAPGMQPPQRFSAALPAAVRDAAAAVLNVCGFVVCFTVFSALLDTNGFLSLLTGGLAARFGLRLEWVRALLMGLLELGGGAGAMRGLQLNGENLALAAFLLGWGGVSVHFQTLSAIADTNIKGTLHFTGRLLSAALGAALAYLMSLFLL